MPASNPNPRVPVSARVQPNILKEAKQLAKDSQMTLSQVLELALHNFIMKHRNHEWAVRNRK